MDIKSKSWSCLSRDYVDVIAVERHLHPRSLNLWWAEQHFLGSCILIKKYSKGSHLGKCQSLHFIKTCKIWPLRGTSLLSPANCLRYEFCEQKSVPAKHVFLKIKLHFCGISGLVWRIPKGLFILTSFRGAIPLIWCRIHLDPSPAQFTTRSHFP